MDIYRTLQELPNSARGGAVSIGNFDGVHLGHVAIVERLRQRALEVGGPSIVFTFDPHPVTLLRPTEAPIPLSTSQQKASMLADLGVDVLIAFQTTREMLTLTAEVFFQQVIRDQLDARAMIEGPNFYFGRNREGDVSTLKEFCGAANMSLDVVDAIKINNDYVSSSRIRGLLTSGSVADVVPLLARHYSVSGRVVEGARRGTELGFPTANVDQVETLLPSAGVYAGRVRFGDDAWDAAINVGSSPTFSDTSHRIEAHLLDFEGDLYNHDIEIEFHSRIRDIVTFDSVDELIEQLQKDVAQTRTNLAT